MPIRPRYSERQRASEPRSVVTVDEATKRSLNAIVQVFVFNTSDNYIREASCGFCFESYQPDINVVSQRIRIELGRIDDVYLNHLFPANETDSIFDLIEVYFDLMCDYRDRMEECRNRVNCMMVDKLSKFVGSVNRVFERDKITYELNNDGQIVRIGAPVLSDMIQSAAFATGDAELDGLLETARDKFISRDPAVRREGLEKLWDAWERLKTVESGRDKKESVTALLDRVADGPMRERLECEARELTDIGNDFMIRHSEVDRHPLDDDRHVDYLFHRMFFDGAHVA